MAQTSEVSPCLALAVGLMWITLSPTLIGLQSTQHQMAEKHMRGIKDQHKRTQSSSDSFIVYSFSDGRSKTKIQ